MSGQGQAGTDSVATQLPAAEAMCQVSVSEDVFAWLSKSPEKINWLGNRDLDEMIDLYDTVVAGAELKAAAWRQIRAGLERLEATG